MRSAYLIVIVLAAAANFYAGICDFTRPHWLLVNIKRLEVEERWLPTLGLLKLLGALGLLAGVVVPQIGVAAAAGLVLYFVGAMVTVLRARWYANLPFPLTWLALAVGSFVLCLRAA
ncbi:MAG TPA: DoxX family protein [Alloacidobacterium sp.]|nr:DoxX family protein [Alloacidobacterium sp.]